jgi:hypothetical protein
MTTKPHITRVCGDRGVWGWSVKWMDYYLPNEERPCPWVPHETFSHETIKGAWINYQQWVR